MTKWVLGLLVGMNIAFFAVMQWGGALTTDVNSLGVQPALHAEKIRVVSDIGSASLAISSVSPATGASSNSGGYAPTTITTPELTSNFKQSRQCLEWGEFSGRALADAQASLAALKLGEKMSQHIIEHAGGFWVYIPPLKDHAEVQKKIDQLKKRGVEDYFVVQEEGAWLNTISLGVFRTEEAAQRFFTTVREKGVRSAKVGERMSKLKFTVFTMMDMDAPTADRIRALQKGFPDSELKTLDCN